MPKPLETTIAPNPKDTEEEDGDLSGLNSPELDPKTGKATKKAISGFKQAHSIAIGLFDKAVSGRLKTTATVAKKYAGESPFKHADLKATGQTWRNNFSTNPLASVVDRAKPQLTDPIKQTDSLTYSKLPSYRENAAEKTRKFRKRTTDLIRAWSAWIDFVDSVAQEDYLNGGAVPGWLDDDWRPKAFRADEVFLPESTGQHASKVPFVVFRRPEQIHDFIDRLKDKEIAKAAGYDWDGCIKAANEASGRQAHSSESPLAESDAMRELGTLGEIDAEAKVIWIFDIFVREYGGGVALWSVAQHGGHPIRQVDNIFEKMEDSVAIFTLQTGNERFYGSKGAGRLLANLHIAIDRGRNLASDQVYLNGLPILRCDTKMLNSIHPVVRHPFILVPKEVEIAKEQVEFDWNAFKYIDESLIGIMEAIAGAFIPPKLDNQGSSNTKIEAAQKAERELAIRNGVLGRFFGNFGDLVSAMQRKIYSPDNLSEAKRIHEENKAQNAKGKKVLPLRIWEWLKKVTGLLDENVVAPQSKTKIADTEAVEAIVDLMTEGLSIEEIVELALSPAGNNMEEEGEALDDKTVQFIEAKMQSQNPYFDQKNMASMQAELMVGADRAERLVVKDREDPNIEAIAARQQIIEFAFMMDGEAMPVAITDHHTIHRKVLLEKATPVIMALGKNPTPELLQPSKLIVQHFATHLAMDMQIPPEQKLKEEEGVQLWVKAIEDAEKAIGEMVKAAAEAGATGPIPPPMPGQPPQPPPNPELDLEREKLQAQTLLEARKLATEERKVDLKAQELQMKDEQQTMQTVTQTMQHVADEAGASLKEGKADAEADLQATIEGREPKA